MNSKIEKEGLWFACDLAHPHNEPAIEILMPHGLKSFQPSPYARYNAKLTMSGPAPIVQAGIYNVRHNNQSLKLQVEKSESDVLWCNLL